MQGSGGHWIAGKKQKGGVSGRGRIGGSPFGCFPYGKGKIFPLTGQANGCLKLVPGTVQACWSVSAQVRIASISHNDFIEA